MKKYSYGIVLGIVAGIIDVIPMILQNLAIESDISAFLFWVIVGFFISTTDLKIKGALKGVSISLLMLIPLAPIIAWQTPMTLIPIVIMNLILGSLLGFLIEKKSI
jgi:hypothetical protein